MNILVLGGGGREHAIVKALKKSKKVKHISCAPGNPGMARDATCHLTDPTDMRTVLELANRIKPDLVVVGPEAPLAQGVADALRRNDYKVFGPNQRAAQLESSKVFAKEFMLKYGIPTSKFVVCSSKEELLAVQGQFSPPWVIKADGLAAGKGVRICESEPEFKKCASEFFDRKILGSATDKVLLEEHVVGTELSLLCVVADGKYEILPVAQDFKRLQDDDKGPNTGGMGAYAPVKSWDKYIKKIQEKVIEPTMRGLQAEHFDYRGILYFGIMMKDGEPVVLEYNVRFGDPEAQVIIPLMAGDWADVFMKVAEGKIPKLTWNKNFAICIVIAAPGYPHDPQRGLRVVIDKEFIKKTTPLNYYLHAGTASHNGYITSGGRVLNVVAIEKTLSLAHNKAYDLVYGILLEGMQFRTDIAKVKTKAKLKVKSKTKSVSKKKSKKK